jgi:hypothetical protein
MATTRPPLLSGRPQVICAGLRSFVRSLAEQGVATVVAKRTARIRSSARGNGDGCEDAVNVDDR